MMKNAFYFTLKTIFVPKIHILPNISQSKNNQTMKFGQVIEYKWETFFLKNHTQNVTEKLVPDFF